MRQFVWIMANIELLLRGNPIINNKSRKQIKVLCEYSAEKLNQDISNWNNDNFYSMEDVDEKFEQFIHNLSNSVNRFIKIKSFPIHNEFFDNELEMMRRQKK